MGFGSSSHGLLARIARNTEWSQLLDFVSPSLFDVMPLRTLLGQGRELASNATRPLNPLRDAVQARLEAAEIDVRIVASHDAAPPPPEQCLAMGQRALEVYFAQLAEGDVTLLDLRYACWSRPAEGPLLWAPRPAWIRWDPTFIDGVRQLYRGFYRDDDGAYRKGVEILGLGEAGDLLRKHFGEGDQRAVRFDTGVFQTTFHQVFVRCRDRGLSLHGNFLALGVYLATLYDLLEGLDEAFDVRDAYDRVNA
ncbi:MAG: hypothetical protein AAF430_26515 [Myxococcota bacterium]